MFQPVIVTAYLAGSLAIARPSDISLDGLLAYQVLRQHMGEAFYVHAGGREVLRFARLPLEMRGDIAPFVRDLQTGDVWMNTAEGLTDQSFWYWSCSAAQIEVAARQTQYWNKRFDTQPSLSNHVDFGGRVEKIIIENGRYKAYHMPLPTLITNKVVWYAYGDMEQIRMLLVPITAIGKKRNYGNGMVIRWSVEPMEEDWSEWKEDRLMRPLPGPAALQWIDRGVFDLAHMAFRAPQWHPANQAMCLSQGRRNAA
jgi:CRISPR type IV-associated protein Csf3